MTCDKMQLHISMYLDEALDAKSQAAMFSHLSTCSVCRTFLCRSLAIRSTLALLPPPEVPPSLDGRVLTADVRPGVPRVREHSPLRRLWSHRLSIPLPAAAVFAIALVTATVLAASFWLKTDSDKQEVVNMLSLPTINVYAQQSMKPSN